MSDIWFESRGVRLFAAEHGAGPPIVLLHGGLAAHEAVQPFAAPLAERHRVITPDLRASGRSLFAGALSWDLFAADVAALLAHLGIERAVVGGISFGAGVAVRVALRYPAVVERLVLLHPAYGGVPLTAAQWRAMHAMDEAGRRAPSEGSSVLFPLVDQLPPMIRERARALFATYDPASVAASTRFMASGEQPFTLDELAAITAPTLIVPGIDPEHPHEVAEILARIPCATVVTSTDLGSAIARWLG
jgi:pimeloyl-ACP methyl ester carboxylesterase